MKTCYWPKAQLIQSYIPYLILLANKVAVNRGANGLDWTAAMRGQTQEECIADATDKMNSCLGKTEEKTTACRAKGYPDGERRCTMFKHEYQHMCKYRFVTACQWARTAGDASPISRFCWMLISSTKASFNSLIFARALYSLVFFPCLESTSCFCVDGNKYSSHDKREVDVLGAREWYANKVRQKCLATEVTYVTKPLVHLLRALST